MAAIGNSPTQQAFTPAVDYFSGNGSTTAFTLSRPVASVAQVQVTIDNVAQNPSSAFTVSSNTITFTSAPLSGTNNIYVYYTSPITQVIAPGQGTVTATSMASSTGTGAGVFQTSPTITTPVISSLSSASATALTLQSAGTTAITVDTSQNVGIGTASPANKLTLNSGFVQTGNGIGGAGGVWFPTSTGSADCRTWRTRSDIAGYGDFGIEQSTTQTGTTFATKFLISQAGYITTPAQPYFYVRTSLAGDNQTQSNPFLNGSVATNTGSCYTNSTGRFTAPVAGVYVFVSNPGYKQTSYDMGFRWRVNGNDTADMVRFVGTPPNSHSGGCYTFLLQLAANDYVDMAQQFTYYHSNASLNFWSGYLLG